MTNPALELARQRAQEDAQQGVTTNSIRMPGGVRQSPTDWGALRGPSDPNADGGISVVSLPSIAGYEIDDGGLGAEVHPGDQPYKQLLAKPRDELTQEERDLVYDKLVEKERAWQAQRDAIALEHDKFKLHKSKSTFDLVKKFAIGFGVLAAAGFTSLIGLLVWVSVKKTDFTDTSVITSILNTFSAFFNTLASM